MTRTQAKALAVKLKNEGKEYAEIAEALKAAGYTSSRTKEPLTPGGVNQMLLAAGHRCRSIRKDARRKVAPPHVGAAERVGKAKGAEAKLAALQSLFRVRNMDPAEQVALASLLLEA